jgi:hypothetical protein
MKYGRLMFLIPCALLAFALPSFAQTPRLDAIWARATAGPITLDGVFDEPAWAQAESVVVRYAYNSGIPGSGWKTEGGQGYEADSTYAVLKFLTIGNQLYMAATVRDSSIGGSSVFNKFDGFLMSLKNHSSSSHPSPPSEYLYSWWYPSNLDPQPVDQQPSFKGLWAELPVGSPRTATQIANWDAATKVHGHSNSDSAPDSGYTVEMRFNLTPMGYNITQSAGDIIEWNISIYDCDWFWPNTGRSSTTRTWWQGPWGGDALYNEVRIYAKPAVTTASGPVPVIPVELTVPNAAGFTAPTINGGLSETVWSVAPSFDIRYGDDALRATYPGVFRYRAGQFQPPVNASQQFVDDPGDVTVKYFFKEDTLYLGFDVRDKKVAYEANFDRWDGFIVSINDRAEQSFDHNLAGRRLSFQINSDGTALPQDYLASMVAAGKARVAILPKVGTTIDTVGANTDPGYTAELALDMTGLGYPHGLGDGLLFLGINLLDGDNYPTWQDSYADRTWWMREYEGTCCPTWAYMDHNVGVAAVGDPPAATNRYFQLLGNAPNPFAERTSIRFVMARSGDVNLEVYDVQGRMVESRAFPDLPAGQQQVAFDQNHLRSGVYLYRLKMTDRATRTLMATLAGNMLVIR